MKHRNILERATDIAAVNTSKADMNTLSNVDTRRGGTAPPHAGFTSDVFPEAQGSPTGVSVRYAPDPAKQWFVLRTTYARVLKAHKYLTQDGTETYFPQHYAHKVFDGKKKRVLEPLIPNILFVYATPEKVEAYVKHTPALSYLSYYYNHFQTDAQGKNPPLTVPYEEMMNFIRATSVDNEHIQLVSPEQCRYKSGDLVRVVEGDFKGIVGKVARVRGQQCVVIEIEGLCMVATAYVPTAFIQKI